MNSSPSKLQRFLHLARLRHPSTWKALALFCTEPRHEPYFERLRKVRTSQYLAAPEPWLAQPAVRALEGIVKPSDRVFEWGSGASTLWFSRHAREVTTVEHDFRWAEEVERRAAPNVTVLRRQLDEAYLLSLADPVCFDLFLIDGRRRSDCAGLVAQQIQDGKIRRGSHIVFDDVHRERYWPGLDALTNASEHVRYYCDISDRATAKMTVIARA